MLYIFLHSLPYYSFIISPADVVAFAASNHGIQPQQHIHHIYCSRCHRFCSSPFVMEPFIPSLSSSPSKSSRCDIFLSDQSKTLRCSLRLSLISLRRKVFIQLIIFLAPRFLITATTVLQLLSTSRQLSTKRLLQVMTATKVLQPLTRQLQVIMTNQPVPMQLRKWQQQRCCNYQSADSCQQKGCCKYS